MAALDTSRAKIQHLLRRAGFGYRAGELDEYVALGLAGTVERLLDPPPEDVAVDAAVMRLLAPFDGPALDRDLDRERRAALYRAWYVRMAGTRRPLVERMTYFWHDHFATSLSKVTWASLMQTQNDTFRRLALGSFEELLLAIARDPAMLLFLDNRTNSRTRPNENYARELMELHTLGEGNGYTETDIKEAARALTGWRLAEDGTAVFRRPEHDPGTKTVLGKTGTFNDADIVHLLASHRGTARYVTDKLVRFFVRPDGHAALAARAADTYMATNGSIREVLRTILLAPEMYEPAAYRSIIKSPTEVMVGLRRALEAPLESRAETETGRLLGQLIYEPPNPAGWTGGGDWINATTTLGRANYAARLTAIKADVNPDIPGLYRRNRVTGSAASVVDWTLDLLVGGDVEDATRSLLIEHLGGTHFDFEVAAREGRLHGMVYLAASMPLYQVA